MHPMSRHSSSALLAVRSGTHRDALLPRGMPLALRQREQVAVGKSTCDAWMEVHRGRRSTLYLYCRYPQLVAIAPGLIVASVPRRPQEIGLGVRTRPSGEEGGDVRFWRFFVV